VASSLTLAKAEFLVGFSCKTRMLCPSCHTKRLTIWSEWLGAELLASFPHRMITLTVPKRIRPFFLWDRKLLGVVLPEKCQESDFVLVTAEAKGN